MKHQEVGDPLEGGETPFSAWWDPKTPWGAPGWEGAGSSRGPWSGWCNPTSARGSDLQPPFMGTTGQRRQPVSSQHPSQNRGFCWASKTEKNTLALQ